MTYSRKSSSHADNKKRSFGKHRPRSHGSGGNAGKRNRPVITFNPSLLIKKVEETVAAPIYVPKHTFADFAIIDQLKKNIADKGYVAPTPIQDQAIPYLLEGKDLIGTANTGTGKTAAFLIPLVHAIATQKVQRALIIVPTRELALQIQEELAAFKRGLSLNSVVCIGGVNIGNQITLLRKNPQFVIGTPGRLKDLEKQNVIRFFNYDAIVLDEVDRMLDMGFINDIEYVIARLPKKRHSLFFSATLSPEIKPIMERFLHDPIAVSVKTRQTAENVNQDIIKVNQGNKIDLLHDLLIKPEFAKVIIFVRTKRNVEKLAKALRERGFTVAAIHGDKTQSQRQKALDAFKDNNVKILLATDVVARGIDIDDISHVINYDMPQTYEDYIHRIGRTGRAQKIGQALTFVE